MSFVVLLHNQVLISTLYWQRIFEDVNLFSINHSVVKLMRALEENNRLIALACYYNLFSIKPTIMTRLENFCLLAPVLKQLCFNIPCNVHT